VCFELEPLNTIDNFEHIKSYIITQIPSRYENRFLYVYLYNKNTPYYIILETRYVV
jgi:hypothetical protein